MNRNLLSLLDSIALVGLSAGPAANGAPFGWRHAG